MKKPKVRVYGFNQTIHKTNYLDIHTDSNGNVIEVWFRCQPLPFVQYSLTTDKLVPNDKDVKRLSKLPKIHAITLEDSDEK